MDTSHPIAASCESTADADDIFDGISYGKGASWLHQMVYQFGQPMLKEGLKTYFAKYSFKNTELSDFVAELSKAAVTVGAVQNEAEMLNWAESWLKSAGCAQIELDHCSAYTSANGQLISVKVRQTPFNQKNTPENKLRVQKFIVALLDKDMKVIREIPHTTSDEKAVTEIKELQGVETPHAFLINYQAHGYGKFIIDGMTLAAL